MCVMCLGLLHFTTPLAADVSHEPGCSRLCVLLGRLLQAALIYCKAEKTNGFTVTASWHQHYLHTLLALAVNLLLNYLVRPQNPHPGLGVPYILHILDFTLFERTHFKSGNGVNEQISWRENTNVQVSIRLSSAACKSHFG